MDARIGTLPGLASSRDRAVGFAIQRQDAIADLRNSVDLLPKENSQGLDIDRFRLNWSQCFHFVDLISELQALSVNIALTTLPRFVAHAVSSFH